MCWSAALPPVLIVVWSDFTLLHMSHLGLVIRVTCLGRDANARFVAVVFCGGISRLLQSRPLCASKVLWDGRPIQVLLLALNDVPGIVLSILHTKPSWPPTSALHGGRDIHRPRTGFTEDVFTRVTEARIRSLFWFPWVLNGGSK
jgi:hypothetical protein